MFTRGLEGGKEIPATWRKDLHRGARSLKEEISEELRRGPLGPRNPEGGQLKGVGYPSRRGQIFEINRTNHKGIGGNISLWSREKS